MYLSLDDRNLGQDNMFPKRGEIAQKMAYVCRIGNSFCHLPVFGIKWKIQKLQCKRYIVGKMRSLQTSAFTLTTGLQDPATIFPKWAEMVQKIAYLRGNNAFQRNI